MNTPRRFPIFVQDKAVFDSLSKKIGSHAIVAADLPECFEPLSRHAVEFGAKCFGSTSRQRLFAEVRSTPPTVEPGVSRQDIARQCESAIKHGANKLAAVGTITFEQARAIVEAAPAIVRAVAKDLQLLEVDRLTFERNVLDPLLLAARAPKFEYAITSDYSAVFIFDAARQALRAAAGEDSSEAVSKIKPDDIQKILRNSLLPLHDAVRQGTLPLTHVPIVLSDEGGDVVGVSFQHPVHLGITPVCCEDEERFWAIAAALHAGQPAQNTHGSERTLHFTDPNSVRPYLPTGRFPSIFNSKEEDDNGPPVYFAQVSVEKAIGYLQRLAKAVNDQRVRCTESDRSLMKSASLSSVKVISFGSGTTRTFWGLVSHQSRPGQSKVTSASGTTRGLLYEGHWADQWYLRQIYWLGDSDFPELGMPSDHFLRPSHHVDVTKIIPDDTEDFTRRAIEHVNGMPKEHKCDSAIRTAMASLQVQKKQLQEVKNVLEAEKLARVSARQAGLAATGPEVLPPV